MEKMSKFKYMNFTFGHMITYFVTHAKKYTKEETLELYKFENKHLIKDGFKAPTVDDIRELSVRFLPSMPEGCLSYEFPDGGYTFCRKGEKGSFLVWIIDIDALKER